MAISCTRRIQWCSGHRVVGHESKCAYLHGHNYVAELTAEQIDPGTGLGVDCIGRVVDFSVLKARIGAWIEAHWDHGFIVCHGDHAAITALEAFDRAMQAPKTMAPAGFKQRVYVLPVNPTAENIARFLLERVGPACLGGTGVRLTRVLVRETENCWAEAKIGDEPGIPGPAIIVRELAAAANPPADPAAAPVVGAVVGSVIGARVPLVRGDGITVDRFTGQPIQ